MMLLEHIVACGWFGLGIMEKECTWLQKNDLLEASLACLLGVFRMNFGAFGPMNGRFPGPRKHEIPLLAPQS